MSKAGFPLANIFARSDFFPLSLSFRLKPSATNKVKPKEKIGTLCVHVSAKQSAKGGKSYINVMH